MPTTPNVAFPFPDDEDWLNQGAYAIEQLAQAADARLRHDYVTVGAPAAVGLADNTWTDVTWTVAGTSATDFAVSGSTTTYNGPAGLFLIGYAVGLFGITKNARLAFPAGGAQPVSADYSSTPVFSTLHRTQLAFLSPGHTLGLQVMVGIGGSGAQQSDASLFAVRL